MNTPGLLKNAGGTAPADAPAFAIKQLAFGYHPGAPVLHDIDVQFGPGRLTALLGPNAAGKSTLLKLMLGQESPWRGEIDCFGAPIAALPADQRAQQISYVPQRGGQAFGYTVRDMVTMGRFAHRALDAGDQAVIQETLNTCDLADVADRVYVELSGGQQQRVLLARAIAQAHGTGRVMLLDEPAAGMDLRHVHEMMTQLRGLCDAGLTVVIVMHDVNLAAQYADDVCLMDGGRVAAAGACVDVMTPDVLSPVYSVDFSDLRPQGASRPVFAVGFPRTMQASSSADDGLGKTS